MRWLLWFVLIPQPYLVAGWLGQVGWPQIDFGAVLCLFLILFAEPALLPGLLLGAAVGRGLVNEYAAVPSFHVGWNVLAAVFLWRTPPIRRLRPLAVVSPVAMSLAVVFTANHYVFDAFAGIAVSTFGLWAGSRLAGLPIPILGRGRRPAGDAESAGEDQRQLVTSA